MLESTFLSYQKVSKKLLSKFWLTWPFQWLTYFLVSDKYAVNKEVVKLKNLPLLIIHGKKDPVVPFSFGKALFENSGHPKKFYPVDEGRHIDTMWIENGIHRKVFLDFIDENLKKSKMVN